MSSAVGLCYNNSVHPTGLFPAGQTTRPAQVSPACGGFFFL
jgi:hypothetical protein